MKSTLRYAKKLVEADNQASKKRTKAQNSLKLLRT